ncbi:hypothetical protein BYT27DRAFT_7196820 [Phlegmacium glaucopus]|nr:hypothetical protein BYT27DRAFT_7196820 [Phlegmacium glaucopus]
MSFLVLSVAIFSPCLDDEAAASAVRNLSKDRNLRVNLADSDPYLEGKTTESGVPGGLASQ